MTKIFLPLALAAGLVGLLFAILNVSFAAIVEALARFDAVTLAAIAACTAAYVSLSALKWLLVHNIVQAERQDNLGWPSAFLLTSLGAALSIVAIPQVAVMATRSVGAKYGLGKSASGTAAATAFEQVFDLVPLIIFAGITLAALAFGWGSATWFAATVAVLSLAAAILAASSQSLGRFLSAAANILPKRLHRYIAWVSRPEAAVLLHPRFTAKILAISYVRYGAVFLRAFIIIRVMGLGIDTVDFAQAFSLVRAVGLIALTPGSLGITEWSWTGVLALFGLAAASAATFALTNRVVNSLAVLVVLLLALAQQKLRTAPGGTRKDCEGPPA